MVKKERYSAIKASFAMFLSSLLDVITIILVYPMVILLSDPNQFSRFIEHNILVSKFINLNTKIDHIELIFIGLTIFLSILSFIARVFTQKLYLNFTFQFGERLKNSLFKALLNINLSTINKIHSSEVMAAISNRVDSVAFNVIMQIMIFLNAFIFVIILIITGIFTNIYVMLLVIILICPIYFIFIRATKFKIKNNSVSISVETENTIKSVAETYRCFKEIRVNNIENLILKSFNTSTKKLSYSQASNQLLATIPKYLIESLILITLAVIAYYSVFFEPNVSPRGLFATFGTAGIAFLRIVPFANALYSSNTTIRATKNQLISLRNTLSNFLITNKNSQHSVDEKLLPELTIEMCRNFSDKDIKNLEFLSLKKVQIQEINTQNILIENINLELFSGDWTLITGSSGSGKTTLIDSIIGFRNISHGEIEVNGEKKLPDTLISKYCKVGYVTQGAFLFSDTVLNNITLGFSGSGIEARSIVAKLLLLVGLANSTSEANIFMDKHVGENGVNVSGGQKQRIAICRALHKFPDLLILDEGTGALDNLSEEKVFNAIKAYLPNAVVIVVSHHIKLNNFFNKHYELSMNTLMQKYA